MLLRKCKRVYKLSKLKQSKKAAHANAASLLEVNQQQQRVIEGHRQIAKATNKQCKQNTQTTIKSL